MSGMLKENILIGKRVEAELFSKVELVFLCNTKDMEGEETADEVNKSIKELVIDNGKAPAGLSFPDKEGNWYINAIHKKELK